MEALLKENKQLAAARTSAQHEVHQTTQASSSNSSENLFQALEELSLTNNENEKLTETLSKMEKNKIK